jgi:uncharacterized protein YjbI with pentapeptide repeats
MSDPHTLISQRQGRGLSRGEIPDLKPRSDLTFRVFDQMKVKDADVYQSLLNGCLFRECNFENVRFSRCDLEQIQFQNCNFKNVSFVNIELTSGHIAGSQFEDCDFRSALITDTVLTNCTFQHCSFLQAVIRSNKFDECSLVKSGLRGASVQLDSFRRTQFEDIKLGNCTFLNHILSQCTYKNVHINAESIGALFGITEQDLACFKLIYLGQKTSHNAHGEDLFTALNREYERRRWVFMQAVLRLNFGRVARITGLNECLSAVLWPASLGAPLKTADIAFLEMIVLDLFSHEKLPALNAVLIPEAIQNFLDATTADAIGRPAALMLQQLASRINMLLLDLFNRYSAETMLCGEDDRQLHATLVFMRRPKCNVVAFINEVALASGLPIRSETVTLKEESGSYLLYVQTTLITLGALQTALWLLNGCATQVIEMKSRLQIIAQKRPPKVIRNRVLLAEQTVPRWMVLVIQGIVTKITGSPTALNQVAADLSQDNLQRIEVENGPLRAPLKTHVNKSRKG